MLYCVSGKRKLQSLSLHLYLSLCVNLRLTLSTIGDVENRKNEDENEDEDRLRGEKRRGSGRIRADSAKSRDSIALKSSRGFSASIFCRFERLDDSSTT